MKPKSHGTIVHWVSFTANCVTTSTQLLRSTNPLSSKTHFIDYNVQKFSQNEQPVTTSIFLCIKHRTYALDNTTRQRSCRKIMFLVLSVSQSVLEGWDSLALVRLDMFKLVHLDLTIQPYRDLPHLPSPSGTSWKAVSWLSTQRSSCSLCRQIIQQQKSQKSLPIIEILTSLYLCSRTDIPCTCAD